MRPAADPTPIRAVLPPGRRVLRRLFANRAAAAGAVLLLVVFLLAFVGPPLLHLLVGKDAETQHVDLALEAPSWSEPFGRDDLGRSYLVRVLAGGRTSLLVGLAATFVTVVVGTAYGAVAGYYGGRLDEVMMRFVDFLYGIPFVFLAILVMLMFEDTARGNPVPVFVALGLVQWLTMARIVRGHVLSLRDREFVLAARVLGASDARILLRHVVPNVLGVVLVYATLSVPAVILLESFLSYLGLGLSLSWGQLVSEAVNVVNPVSSYAWLLVWPSVFLAVTLLC